MQERWRDGDGYLTASEIAALKLDADRVILSSGLLGTPYRLSVWCDFRRGHMQTGAMAYKPTNPPCYPYRMPSLAPLRNSSTLVAKGGTALWFARL